MCCNRNGQFWHFLPWNAVEKGRWRRMQHADAIQHEIVCSHVDVQLVEAQYLHQDLENR